MPNEFVANTHGISADKLNDVNSVAPELVEKIKTVFPDAELETGVVRSVDIEKNEFNDSFSSGNHNVKSESQWYSCKLKIELANDGPVYTGHHKLSENDPNALNIGDIVSYLNTSKKGASPLGSLYVKHSKDKPQGMVQSWLYFNTSKPRHYFLNALSRVWTTVIFLAIATFLIAIFGNLTGEQPNQLVMIEGAILVCVFLYSLIFNDYKELMNERENSIKKNQLINEFYKELGKITENDLAISFESKDMERVYAQADLAISPYRKLTSVEVDDELSNIVSAKRELLEQFTEKYNIQLEQFSLFGTTSFDCERQNQIVQVIDRETQITNDFLDSETKKYQTVRYYRGDNYSHSTTNYIGSNFTHRDIDTMQGVIRVMDHLGDVHTLPIDGDFVKDVNINDYLCLTTITSKPDSKKQLAPFVSLSTIKEAHSWHNSSLSKLQKVSTMAAVLSVAIVGIAGVNLYSEMNSIQGVTHLSFTMLGSLLAVAGVAKLINSFKFNKQNERIMHMVGSFSKYAKDKDPSIRLASIDKRIRAITELVDTPEIHADKAS